MIKIYYTTPEKEGAEQIRPTLSLGGFRASNSVLNDEFGNLFGEITPLTIDKNKEEYRALIIKNVGESTLTNVRLWFEVPEDNYAKIELAAVTLNEDAEGQKYMEHVDTIFSRPLYAEFSSVDGEENAATIGELLPGASVGLWLRRSLLIEKISEELKKKFVRNIDKKIYEEIALNDSETIGLVIDWE